jgi:ArsR family transcriptional regulator, arsenate/arsenite/antimonite-responsive transcriptional repressor
LAPAIAKQQELTGLAFIFYNSRIMDISEAISALGGLAQESRLKVFRLLMRAGSGGMPAGEIARALSVPSNTMSSHLAILTRAKLVQARRQGRSVIYAVDFDGTRALLSFLVEDCCQGEPAVCRPLIDSTLAACCSE